MNINLNKKPSVFAHLSKPFSRVLLLVLTLGLPLSSQAIVTAFISQNVDNTYTYEYTVDNQNAFEIVSWSLALDLLPSDIDWLPTDVNSGGDVTVPLLTASPFDDWFAFGNTDGSGFFVQDFNSFDPTSDIPEAIQLSGFSFISSLAPDTVSYTEFGALGETFVGTVLAPGVIPEPSTIIAIFLITALGLGFRRKLK